MKKSLIILVLLITHSSFLIDAMAQVGEYRNDLAVGVNGGYTMSSVGFTPEIPQKMLGGITGGVTLRYTCEKYFKSICAIVAEVNYTEMGWKEDILTADDQPVINPFTKQPEEYERKVSYIQVPMMARMGWGRERKGFQGFIQLGPQIGFYLSDKSKQNFDFESRNTNDRIGVQRMAPQDTMAIENKFDYGIVGGAGVEWSIPKVGHFMLEGRYYFGLGNLYGNAKKDFFGKSNNSSIMIKLTYLFDVFRTEKKKH